MSLDAALSTLAGKRVLVTGGSGFIGGRLVERLVLDAGAEVRALVRSFASAARLARFPVEFVHGDVTDRQALARAATGCDVVFHCAYGTRGSQPHRAFVNREGTRRVLEAAGRAGARRVVHLSTLMVYGRTADGDLTEESPRKRFGNAYADSKLDAERLALAWAKAGKAPATVLQPTAVYGPWGGVWTEQVLGALRSQRLILVDGGVGLCNYVYVDDLVAAMLLAATAGGAVGEAFLISSDSPVSWTDWYGRFAAMLGLEGRLVSMSREQALAHWRRHQKERPWLLTEAKRAFLGDRELRDRLMETRDLRQLRELASRLLPEAWQQRIKRRMGSKPALAPAAGDDEPPIQPLTPEMITFLATRTRARIDKARRLLGYEPAMSLDAGLDLTARWARWANLL